ncbi:MAG: alpha/beta fold hydrolase [Desulforhopalus sp.]|nr:alpha/beta fold hydrolase [Desulforhopalus sp.]
MKLHYNKTGTGPPLILIHGLFGNGENLLPLAQSLAPHFTVYLPDLRNHGLSPHAEDQSHAAMAEDLHQFVVEEKIARTAVAGHSMGGKVAMSFTLSFPHLVTRLVSLDMAPMDYNSEYSDVLEKSIAVMMELNLTQFSSRGAVMEEMRKRLKDRKLVGFFAKNLEKERGKFYWRCNLPAFRKYITAIRGGLEEFAPLAPCPVPALFLFGGESGYLQPGVRKQIQRFFPDNSVKVIPQAGHWLHSDQPVMVRETVFHFLTE